MDNLANFLLFIGNAWLIAPVLILFTYFTWDNRAIPINLVGICIFTIIYNIFLKELFGIPLKEPLVGFALPSGHMHFALVFYLHIALFFRKNIWTPAIFMSLIVGLSFALLAKGYHNIIDLFAAIFFGFITLTIFARVRLFIFSLIGLFLSFFIKPNMFLLSSSLIMLGVWDCILSKKSKEGCKLSLIFLGKNRYNL